MDAKALYRYAWKFARRSEKVGRGTEYPTVKQAAKRFKCRIAEVLECVESSDHHEVGGEYFALAVGVQNSAGYGVYDRESEYRIEAY